MVRFEDFERNIKRFGWTGSLEDQMIQEVSDEIKLNIDDINDERTIQNHFFKSELTFD